MDVGTALQDAREHRGLSLEQLSQATKISVSMLRAIERNRMDQLPEGIFLRGFVRAYAREVGLNPDETVGRYLGQSQPIAPPADNPMTGSGDARAQSSSAVHRALDQAAPTPHAARQPELVVRARLTPSRSALLRSISIVVLAIVGLVGWYTFARWSRTPPLPAFPSPHPQGGVVATTTSSSPVDSSTAVANRPEAATAGSPEPTPAASGEALLRVDLRPQGPCWLSATVDGTRVVYRVMQPGEQQTIEVHNQAVLRIGNPAAFAFSINGKTGRALGPANQPVTLDITAQNYRQFLRP
jgi:cytoskeleton protein RodZ